MKQNGLINEIKPHINMPRFYSDIALLEDIEIMQGNGFKDKPFYLKQEQFICSVDGSV